MWFVVSSLACRSLIVLCYYFIIFETRDTIIFTLLELLEGNETIQTHRMMSSIRPE
jgi:hypothetical protein